MGVGGGRWGVRCDTQRRRGGGAPVTEGRASNFLPISFCSKYGAEVFFTQNTNGLFCGRNQLKKSIQRHECKEYLSIKARINSLQTISWICWICCKTISWICWICCKAISWICCKAISCANLVYCHLDLFQQSWINLF